MNLESFIYLLVFLLWSLAVVQGVPSTLRALRFYQYVKRSVSTAAALRLPDGGFNYQPSAVVIMPCCGVDEKLEQTIRALARQNYQDYHVVFAFESDGDPAFEAIGRWTKDWPRPVHHRVVAGLTDRRAQKIHNLLAAVGQVDDDREALVFLDSDVVPDADWLGHMVAPLADEAVGATTGYRWYVATGGLAAGLRCVWNAATISMLTHAKLNFCWGGSTAILRQRFESLGVADYWSRALSDDYQMTRAVRDGGLQIRFVPQAVIPNRERTTLRAFWSFARRQVIITRICGFGVWKAGLVLCASLVSGGVAVAVLFGLAFLGVFGSATAMYAALAGWIVVSALASAVGILRQLGLRQVLRPPDLTWRDFCWDVFGTLLVGGSLHLNLILASLRTRRVRWRSTEYELISPNETRVLRRVGPG